MSNRVFIISDTHFGHRKILEFEQDARPFVSIEQHDAELVYRWNHTVKKNDTVWHLGDVVFGADFSVLTRLNGVKKLVMGNHDHYATSRYLEHFSQVFGAIQYKNCVLSHIPVHESQKSRFKANLHGHLHSKSMGDPWYINCSAEHHSLTPVLLDTLIGGLK